MPVPLDRKKQIDAICDRFELAWRSPERPEIEQYLELLPAPGRGQLLAELLASELALRQRQNEPCDPDDYTRRFPEHAEIVAEVFRQSRPQAAVDPVAYSRQCLAIVEAVRLRLESESRGGAMPDSSEHTRNLTNQLVRRTLHNPPALAAPADEQLWLPIIQTCSRLRTFDPQGAETVIRSLLAAFPPSRRMILNDVLLGHATDKTAARNSVTQRTVTNTVLAATRLLEQLC
jgi:hypothetical protein